MFHCYWYILVNSSPLFALERKYSCGSFFWLRAVLIEFEFAVASINKWWVMSSPCKLRPLAVLLTYSGSVESVSDGGSIGGVRERGEGYVEKGSGNVNSGGGGSGGSGVREGCGWLQRCIKPVWHQKPPLTLSDRPHTISPHLLLTIMLFGLSLVERYLYSLPEYRLELQRRNYIEIYSYNGLLATRKVIGTTAQKIFPH